MYSLDGYRSLIATAVQSDYEFAGFAEKVNAARRRIYLRHDIDYSLGVAVELARVNADLGVRGTFCLLLRAQSYNLLSAWALRQAEAIHALGQRLALHFAVPEEVPADNKDLAAAVLADFETVRRELPEMEPVFSWHNSTAEVIERGLRCPVRGLVNAYSLRFMKGMPYFSDTNLRHTLAEFESLIRSNEHEELHLLLHPLNWVVGGSSMMEILAGTWTRIIREKELEMRCNRVYAARFPEGMPEALLERLKQALTV